MSVVVVAGATGYLGSHVVQALVREGHHVRALARPGKTVPGAQETIHVHVTQPEQLQGVLEGADAVFSALGITRQTDKVRYEDIDYTANMHLLREAERSGVTRFGVVSVVHPEALQGLAIIDARERFVRALHASEVSSLVVRATGFFSDLAEVFAMAQHGRVWLVGDGQARINPVHGEDLGEATVRALFGTEAEVHVGGPAVYSYTAIAELAFDVLGRPPRITHVPVGLARAGLALVRPFHRRAFDVGSFVVRGSQQDMLGEVQGRHTLRSFYEELRDTAA